MDNYSGHDRGNYQCEHVHDKRRLLVPLQINYKELGVAGRKLIIASLYKLTS